MSWARDRAGEMLLILKKTILDIKLSRFLSGYNLWLKIQFQVLLQKRWDGIYMDSDKTLY